MTTSDVGARSGEARVGVLARHPLVWFFVIAAAGAWVVELPVILSRTGTGLLPYTLPPLVVLLLIAGATFTGPTVAAFVMVRVTEGPEGPKRLLRRYVQWRVPFRWYLFVLLVIPVSEVVGAIVVPGAVGSVQPVTSALVAGYPLAFLTTFLLGGPLGEEPGWRGFALPRLQARFGPLAGATVLGVLWALWHFPLFWSGVWTPLTAANMIMFLVMITLLTIVMAWVFNNVGGSLLLTMLMHASFNTFADKVVAPLFPAPLLNDYVLLPELIGFGLVAVIVIVATRGRLSYAART
ncbi:CPBP family intramembrane glutamic endopeptidase [Pseudonocardia sp. N23]|uniref:CPBP family intramembrane glutamic endopeptidase n=1 Tax=Pseudonocardia sp. N23 TaxID=1987376 RepID=UPI000BFEA779|nr:CPBP family intramembrane glutamic endopeptidase [Pseudonocardia sp. N23]